MLALEFIINAAGTLIYPPALPTSAISGQIGEPNYSQITLIFYNQISTSSTGVITPSSPVTTGLVGTVTLQARTTIDNAWSNIQNGALDISTGANMAFPAGAIGQVQALCSGVTGCNYIQVRLDRSA